LLLGGEEAWGESDGVGKADRISRPAVSYPVQWGGDRRRKRPRITAKLNTYGFMDVPLFTLPLKGFLKLGGEDKIRAQLEWPGLFVLGLGAEGFALNNKKNK
jgi:hypothetical protein